ncbi:xanthine dehydrogenase [Aplysia californica]|uniref:Xanthine dehydrogenase n=1 Tax=Aplysia californica TaxID=6500 RepID=A0ABM0JI81_APLCA|nr:xanthine dehydrogenase [Aplysia californica]
MQAIIVDIYVDSGSRPTVFVLDFMANMDQGFYIPNWKVTMRLMKTDKPIAAPVRGPGAVPASLITESILEHLAREIGMHPILLKELNLYEKGQVAQAVAHGLGIPLDFVKVRPNQNNVTPNAFATGGSTTSERCVASALGAVSILKERLAPFREKMPDAPWPGLVQAAHFGNTHLQASSCHFQNGDPLVYFTYMTSVTETELDVLTGEYQVRRVDIMADLGESLNPTIDIGQIEGGFTFGLGVYLLEDVKYNEMTGAVLTDGTFEYKPPTTKDIPIDWRIHLMPDAPNPVGILSSKAVGEPPVGLAVSALLAIRTAAHSVRDDLEKTDGETVVEAPFTVEKAQQMIGITVDNLRVI